MGNKLDPEEADAEYAAHGLLPLTPYTRAKDERECICERCGTWRRVPLTTLRNPQSFACRWCHGWESWGSWSLEARAMAATWRVIRGEDFSAGQLQILGVIALTPIGDEFTPVGALCPTCGETFVTVPERIDPARPTWNGCQRCATEATRTARSRADEDFAAAGLRLLRPLSGEYVKLPVECMTCGSRRNISYADVKAGSAPLCWTCTHGIAKDEPHRVYLFRFPQLAVLKVGITHNRHDRRLIEHRIEGGVLLETAVVPDRESSLAVEAWVLAKMSRWRAHHVGPEEFPQGGWTEASNEQGAPTVHLAAVCAELGITAAA